jgi:hypothetical protein
VSANELRSAFNDAGYYEEGYPRSDIQVTVFREGLPNPKHEQPTGTRYQTLVYRIGGEPVAIVHQYLLPDGRLGASGLPHPKQVVVPGNGTLTLRPRESDS